MFQNDIPPDGNFVFPGGWGMGIGLSCQRVAGITLADANPNSNPIIDAHVVEPRDREALLVAIEMVV